MTTTNEQSSREQEREALHAAIRDAGGIIHRDGNVFFTNADQLAKVRNVIWLDEQGATHSVSIPYAAELLKQMFDEWPDGMNEIEAAMKWRDREIERLRALSPPSAPGNGEGDAKDAVCYANPVILLPADEGDEGVEWTAKVQGNADETFSLPLFYRPVSEWQPIETCPSDEVVLLYTPDLHPTNPERIESRIYHCTKGGTMHAWATHWMALPAPPAMPSAPAQSGGQGNG